VQSLTQGQTKAFQKIKNYYEDAALHPATLKFRAEARESFGFYDGDGQWTPEEIKQLQKRKQLPVVVNKIKPAIDNITGVEIQTRFRIAYRLHSTNEQDVKLSEALTNYAYGIQEAENFPYHDSIAFRDHFICGLGWTELLREDDFYSYNRIDPFEVIPDPEDLTPQYSNMSYVCREKWVSYEDSLILYPKHKHLFRQMVDEYEQNFSNAPLGGVGFEDSAISYIQKYGRNSHRIRIIEVQYKKPAKLYRTFAESGDEFESFDPHLIEKIAPKKSEIEEVDSKKTMYGFFTGEVFLEHGELPIQPLNVDDFTYFPIVYSRRSSDGVPQGKVRDAMDAQREANKRRSKMLHYLNSNTIVTDAVGQNKEQIREEGARPDGVHIIQPGSRFERHNNLDVANGQFELLSRSDLEIQQSLGIFNEALGQQTNAISGVAIKERQVNSVRNHIPTFDNLKAFKKRVGTGLLRLIQASADTNILVNILRDNTLVETIVLNQATSKNGDIIYDNNVMHINPGVFIEEAPDYESPVQEQADNLMKLLQLPMAPIILQNEALLRRLGIRDAQKLAEDSKSAFSQMQAPDQQMDNPEGVIPPAM
jgi:hypothetical protein